MPINPKREERIGFRSSSFVKLTPVKYYGGRNYTPKYRIENTTHEINGIQNTPKTTQKKEKPTSFVVRPAGVRCRPSGAPHTVPRPPLLARTHRTRNTTTINEKEYNNKKTTTTTENNPKPTHKKKNPPKKPKPPLPLSGLRSRRPAASRWQCGRRGVSRLPSFGFRLSVSPSCREPLAMRPSWRFPFAVFHDPAIYRPKNACRVFTLNQPRAVLWGKAPAYPNGYHPPAPPVRLYPG